MERWYLWYPQISQMGELEKASKETNLYSLYSPHWRCTRPVVNLIGPPPIMLPQLSFFPPSNRWARSLWAWRLPETSPSTSLCPFPQVRLPKTTLEEVTTVHHPHPSYDFTGGSNHLCLSKSGRQSVNVVRLNDTTESTWTLCSCFVGRAGNFLECWGPWPAIQKMFTDWLDCWPVIHTWYMISIYRITQGFLCGSVPLVT